MVLVWFEWGLFNIKYYKPNIMKSGIICFCYFHLLYVYFHLFAVFTNRSPAIDLLCRVDGISNFPLCGWKYPVFRRLTWFKSPELIGLLLIFNLFMPDVYAKMTKTNVFAQSLFVGKNVSNIGNNCYQQKCWYRRKMNQHQDCKILLIFYQH